MIVLLLRGISQVYGALPAGPNFSDAQILDPKNEYTILCVNPLVVVANLDQLGNRNLPCTWDDMLAPEWEKKSDHQGRRRVLLPRGPAAHVQGTRQKRVRGLGKQCA